MFNKLLAFVLLFQACGVEEESASPLAADRAAGPPMVLSGPAEIHPGFTYTFDVAGTLTPGEAVLFELGLGGLGAGPCVPGAPTACLSVVGPVRTIGNVLAGANAATLTVTVPNTAVTGVTVGLQAFAPRGRPSARSSISNAIAMNVTAAVYGCTDAEASNYDANANEDDGSCAYEVYGCTDPAASNFDPAANVDDGSCAYDVYGCTDPAAYNYNPSATVDDFTCAYDVYGCTDPGAGNYDPSATVDDGTCVYPN